MNKYSIYFWDFYLNLSFPWEEHLEDPGHVGNPRCPTCTFPLYLFGDFPHHHSCTLMLEDQDGGIQFQKVCWEGCGLLCIYTVKTLFYMVLALMTLTRKWWFYAGWFWSEIWMLEESVGSLKWSGVVRKYKIRSRRGSKRPWFLSLKKIYLFFFFFFNFFFLP